MEEIYEPLNNYPRELIRTHLLIRELDKRVVEIQTQLPNMQPGSAEHNDAVKTLIELGYEKIDLLQREGIRSRAFEEKIKQNLQILEAKQKESNPIKPVYQPLTREIKSARQNGGNPVEPFNAEEIDQNYCICNQYKEGVEMIGCDSKKCKRQWFHIECMGIDVPPLNKWYCPECQELMKGNKKPPIEPITIKPVIRQENATLVCICRKEKDGKELIECKNKECQVQQYHPKCIGVKTPVAEGWLCPTCTKQRAE